MAATNDPFDLQRFVDAQDRIYDTVVDELTAARKRSHWMWFIFPQLRGLGSSPTAVRFAISSADEARAYLAHELLGPRLRECARLVARIDGRIGRGDLRLARRHEAAVVDDVVRPRRRRQRRLHRCAGEVLRWRGGSGDAGAAGLRSGRCDDQPAVRLDLGAGDGVFWRRTRAGDDSSRRRARTHSATTSSEHRRC